MEVDFAIPNGLVFSHWNIHKTVERGIELQQSSLMEVLSDPFFEIVLKDFDASSNINGTDIAHDNNYRPGLDSC